MWTVTRVPDQFGIAPFQSVRDGLVLGQGVRHSLLLRQSAPDAGTDGAAGQGFQEAAEVVVACSLGDDAVEFEVVGHEFLDLGVLVDAIHGGPQAGSSSGVIFPVA